MTTEVTILIVEDDEGLNKLIQKTLQKAGFNTESVFNGNEAIERANSNKDLIMVLDYKLPDMTGKEVMETLREKGCLVPFIIVTGHGDCGNDEDGRKGLYCQKCRIKGHPAPYS